MQALYYVTRSGQRPVKKYIDSLSVEGQAQVEAAITDMEIQGHTARRPLTDTLQGKIREIRASLGNNKYRILYYFCHKEYIVLLHGLTKKQGPVPSKDIKIAEKRRKDFEERIRSGEIEL